MRGLTTASVALVFVALVLPGGVSGKGEGRDVIFVAAERDNVLVALQPFADGKAGRVLDRIPVPERPYAVATAPWPHDRLVLVTSPAVDRVALVDPRALRIVRVLRVPGGPRDVDVSQDGRYAYVTLEREGRLAVLDLTRMRLARLIEVGAAPHELAVDPDGRRVWVAHGPKSHDVTIVSTVVPLRARVVARISAPGARDIAFACDGRRAWVSFWNSSRIVAFDGSRLRRLLVRRVGARVQAVEASPVSRRIWVTAGADDRAVRLDGCTGQRILAFKVGPRSEARRGHFTTSSRRCLVAHFGNDRCLRSAERPVEKALHVDRKPRRRRSDGLRSTLSSLA